MKKNNESFHYDAVYLLIYVGPSVNNILKTKNMKYSGINQTKIIEELSLKKDPWWVS